MNALYDAVGEILIEEQALQARIAEMGREISADYAGRDLLLVGVLKGAVFFMADLMRHLTVPCDLELWGVDRLLRHRPDPQGPRPLDRGAERARRRGHHRLRPDALVPAPDA